MNPKLFFSVLLVIIIGWFAVGAYASLQKLEQPVFLDHYIDEYSEHGQPLEFYYLTNKGDRNTINYIMLGNIAGYVEGAYIDEFFGPFRENAPYIERYGTRELRSVRIALDAYEISERKEKRVFNEMTVFFSDGQSIVADIGEVIIHPYEQSAKPYLANTLGMNGTEGAASLYQAEENISIMAIEPHIPDEYAENLKIHLPSSIEMINQGNFVEVIEELHVQGEDYRDLEYPVKMEKGENIAFSTQNTKQVNTVINSFMMIKGKAWNGKSVEYPAYLQHLPEWGTLDFKSIIEQKRQEKE